MTDVIASIVEFEKRFPKSPKEGERRAALEKYFSLGGVIKAHESGKDWPKLSYPESMVLGKKIDEIVEKKKLYQEKLGDWKKSHLSASMYHQFHQLKKLKEPLYWEHMAKMASDADYRKDADIVKLPAHLVADKKWKPMVKMFVKDLDYRKQLSETVSTSIIYKKDKKVAKYADELKDFRMEAAGKQVKDLDKKLLVIETAEKALREMQRWTRE
ncbi:MAG: hypothetical protein AABW59_01140 [archaeon]